MHRPDSVLSRAALALAVIFGSLFRGIFADGRAVELHSFTQEMDFHKFTSRWDASGTCIPLHNHISLSPRASDRYGALWHKYPLRTNDFEIEFTIALKSPTVGGDPAHEQGFALWYVYENASSKYSELAHITDGTTDKLQEMGMGMMGYKSNFDGVGIFFYNNKFSSSGQMELRPSASILINDGSQTFDRKKDLPSGHGSYWNYRNTRLTVKIRFKPTDVLVEARVENQAWVKLIEYPISDEKYRLKPGGYIGLTSFVGTTPNQPSERSDMVNIYDLHVSNYDSRMIDGETRIAYNPYRAVPQHDFLEEQIDNGNVGHAEAIRNLVRATYRVIMELEPLRGTAERTVGGLSTRVEELLKEMDELKTAVESIDGGTMAEHYQSLRNELIQVSRETMKSSFEKRRSLDELSAHAQKLGSLGDMSGKIKSRLESQGNTLFYLAVVCLFAVVVVGSGVYAKFRRLEKKHIL